MPTPPPTGDPAGDELDPLDELLTDLHNVGTYAGEAESLAGATGGPSRDGLLGALDRAAAADDRLECAARHLVKLLRDDRASWAAIGAALGISKQGAAKRFGDPRAPLDEPGPGLFDGLDA